MKTYTCSHKMINKVKNVKIDGHKCTNHASACVVGNTLYGIKAENNGYVAFYKIPDYTNADSEVIFYPVKYSDGKYYSCNHANSISICGNSFIIATMNNSSEPAAIVINKVGVIKKEVVHYSDGKRASLSAIEYVRMNDGKKQFLVKSGDINESSTFNPTYRLATLSGEKLIDEPNKFILDAKIPFGYVSNDISYSSGFLYATYFEYNSLGQIYKNHVYGASLTDFDNSKTLSVNKEWIVKKKVTESKFEIETFFIDDKTKYCVANGNLLIGGVTDGLYKLTNK